MATPTFIRAVSWVPERRSNARFLRRATGGAIVWDACHSGAETLHTALRIAAGGPAIHLEDDVALTTNWRDKVEAVVAAHPDVVCQFFSIRKADTEVGSRWDREWINSPCFYVPERLSTDLAAYMPRWQATTEKPGLWDIGIGQFLRDRRERYWLSCPSLVDHLPWESADRPGRRLHRHPPTFEP